MENDVNYKKQACMDVLSFITNKTTKEDFIKAYKSGAQKSIDYTHVVEELMHIGLLNQKYTRENFAEYNGITNEATQTLFNMNQGDGASGALIDAVFDVAYTRKHPTKPEEFEMAGDGNPASYPREINRGLAAERALHSLTTIEEGSEEMICLRERYFFPRLAGWTNKAVSDSQLRESVKIDYITCLEHNQDAASRGVGGKVR